MAMNRDSIVEEVRKHREARAAKFGFNIRAMVEDARKRQAKSGHPGTKTGTDTEIGFNLVFVPDFLKGICPRNMSPKSISQKE